MRLRTAVPRRDHPLPHMLIRPPRAHQVADEPGRAPPPTDLRDHPTPPHPSEPAPPPPTGLGNGARDRTTARSAPTCSSTTATVASIRSTALLTRSSTRPADASTTPPVFATRARPRR